MAPADGDQRDAGLSRDERGDEVDDDAEDRQEQREVDRRVKKRKLPFDRLSFGGRIALDTARREGGIQRGDQLTARAPDPGRRICRNFLSDLLQEHWFAARADVGTFHLGHFAFWESAAALCADDQFAASNGLRGHSRSASFAGVGQIRRHRALKGMPGRLAQGRIGGPERGRPFFAPLPAVRAVHL